MIELQQYIEWRNKQRTTIRGGNVMYDVKGSHLFLHEHELLDFYTKMVCK